MTKTPEYWKAYRIKNKEKLQAYEKARNARRRSTLPLEPSGIVYAVQHPIRYIIPKPESKPRRCQSSFCTKEGREVLVQGFKAWLCELHG